MGADDRMLRVEFTNPHEIHVNPSPHLFYLTGNIEVYNCMMTAIYTYKKECAEAERKMYDQLLTCISKR